MNPTVLFDIEKYHEKAFKKYTDFKDSFLNAIIKENLDSGKIQGLYREEVQSDILARFRLASIFMVLNPELYPATKNSLPSIITEITDNFLYGLVTTKGLKVIEKYKQQRQKI